MKADRKWDIPAVTCPAFPPVLHYRWTMFTHGLCLTMKELQRCTKWINVCFLACFLCFPSLHTFWLLWILQFKINNSVIVVCRLRLLLKLTPSMKHLCLFWLMSWPARGGSRWWFTAEAPGGRRWFNTTRAPAERANQRAERRCTRILNCTNELRAAREATLRLSLTSFRCF